MSGLLLCLKFGDVLSEIELDTGYIKDVNYAVFICVGGNHLCFA